MKKGHSIAASFLASLVLLASLGFVVNVHECGGRVSSVALYVPAHGCPGEALPSCAQKSLAKKSCCKNESIYLKGDDANASTTSIQIGVPSFAMLAPLLRVLYTVEERVRASSFIAPAERPPSPSEDEGIPVFFCTLLI